MSLLKHIPKGWLKSWLKNKKETRSALDKANEEAAELLSELKLYDRVDVFREAEPFITLKDHKDNFRLILPNPMLY